jgi:hypothetical protein
VTDTHHTHRRLRLLPLTVGTAAASIGAGLLVVGVALATGWDAPSSPSADARGIILAAFAAVACVLTASLPALSMIVQGLRGKGNAFGFAVVAAGGLRSILSLTIAIAVYFTAETFKNHSLTFWFALLASNLGCLIVETAWGMRASRLIGSRSAGPGRSISNSTLPNSGILSSGVTG